VHEQMTWQYHKQQGISQKSSLAQCHIHLLRNITHLIYTGNTMYGKFISIEAYQLKLTSFWASSRNQSLWTPSCLLSCGGWYASFMFHRNYIICTWAAQLYGTQCFHIGHQFGHPLLLKLCENGCGHQSSFICLIFLVFKTMWFNHFQTMVGKNNKWQEQQALTHPFLLVKLK
jgi:hypothetical protein